VEGTPFGRYRLVELIGRGGMGEVWKAFDTATRRVVAVKVLPAQLAADPTFEERFRHEAFAAAGLNNPHVVPIHNFGEIEGRLYVDMRLIEGQDLEHVLAAGPMEPTRAVKVIEQIASALNAAHKIGLVHRDVKPSNILVGEDDFSYLIDFGIARAAGETKLTATGNVVGTWPYMAPERFTTGQSDTRSDIYALTCVLYECLTSSRPFPGESVEQQIAGHLTTPPPRPSIKRPDVSPELDAVIASGMAKDPEQRYTTTTEMARAAQAAIASASRTQPAKPGSRQTAAGAAPLIPTQAFQEEDTEKHWPKRRPGRRRRSSRTRTRRRPDRPNRHRPSGRQPTPAHRSTSKRRGRQRRLNPPTKVFSPRGRQPTPEPPTTSKGLGRKRISVRRRRMPRAQQHLHRPSRRRRPRCCPQGRTPTTRRPGRGTGARRLWCRWPS
jgi:serine/threonine protein kinase